VNVGLTGVRILIVEDEYLVAALIQQVLEYAGCLVFGPIARLAEAIDAAAAEPCDAAVLDVNLGGERIFSVAERLRRRNIPFVFVTGYSPEILPPEYGGCPLLRKPFRNGDLLKAVAALVARP
jgi:DNA-binding response OmpR family regulator